jgi:hypothetical protein
MPYRYDPFAPEDPIEAIFLVPTNVRLFVCRFSRPHTPDDRDLCRFRIRRHNPILVVIGLIQDFAERFKQTIGIASATFGCMILFFAAIAVVGTVTCLFVSVVLPFAFMACLFTDGALRPIKKPEEATLTSFFAQCSADSVGHT